MNAQSAQTERTYHLEGKVYTTSAPMQAHYKEDKTKQYTSLFIRTYAPLEEVERVIMALDPDEYAYILHDKDKTGEGEAKQAHYHILVTRKKRMRLTPLVKGFSHNTLVQQACSKKYCYEYLIHKNNLEKAQYDERLIVQKHKNGKDTFRVTELEQREQSNEQFLNDLDTLSRRELACKYGRDYMRNYQRYEAFMRCVEYDEMEADCAQLASEARPDEEVYFLSDLNGDEIRLTLADYICVRLRECMEQNMPTPNQIVALYYKCLRQLREDRRKEAAALGFVFEEKKEFST